MKQKEQIPPPKGQGARCHYCGKGGLEWRQTKTGRWRLYGVGAKWPHVCKQYEPAEEETDDEEDEE